MKTPSAQLDREIAEALSKRGTATRDDEVTDTGGLMKIADAIARKLRDSGLTWGDTSTKHGRNVRVSSSGTQVRFTVPARYQGASGEQCIVDLILVGPNRSITKVGPFAGDQYYDAKFGTAMEQRVRQLLAKGVR